MPAQEERLPYGCQQLTTISLELSVRLRSGLTTHGQRLGRRLIHLLSAVCTRSPNAGTGLPLEHRVSNRVLGPRHGPHRACRSADLRLLNRLLQIATGDLKQRLSSATCQRAAAVSLFPGVSALRLGGGDKRSTPRPQLRMEPQPQDHQAMAHPGAGCSLRTS